MINYLASENSPGGLHTTRYKNLPRRPSYVAPKFWRFTLPSRDGDVDWFFKQTSHFPRYLMMASHNIEMKPSSLKILKQELADYYDVNTKNYSQDRVVKESYIMLKQLKQSKRQLRTRANIIEDYLEELREVLRPYNTVKDPMEDNFRRF